MNNKFKIINKAKGGHAHTLSLALRSFLGKFTSPFFKTRKKIPNLVCGFTLLFSLLILTIILSASLSIYNIVVRQLKISQVSRESSRAFYAADAGLECALYWDFKQKVFDAPTYNIDCLGQNKIKSMTLPASTTDFYLTFTNGSCANVIVNKGDPVLNTIITSYGYNVGDAVSCAPSNRLQVERALQASY